MRGPCLCAKAAEKEEAEGSVDDFECQVLLLFYGQWRLKGFLSMMKTVLKRSFVNHFILFFLFFISLYSF